MRVYELPDGEAIDLDSVARVGALFINKTNPEFNCYEVYFRDGRDSIGVFEIGLSRADFLIAWSGA